MIINPSLPAPPQPPTSEEEKWSRHLPRVFDLPNSTNEQQVEFEASTQMVIDSTSCKEGPRIGMLFDSYDEAWEYWKAYAKKSGFGVRKGFKNKYGPGGSVSSARFMCAKEGMKRNREGPKKFERANTRTGCPVRMGVSLCSKTGKLRLHDFELNHCHDLHFPECTHMIPSHREISKVQAQQIELAEEAGLSQRQQHDFSSVQSGGRQNLGYLRLDIKNYLRTKRLRDMEYGEAGSLLKYFENRSRLDPSFLYSVQFDSNEQITNIFWADSRMLIDYRIFGDVVTFDTTFSTNKEYRPLGIFLGFNHHRELVIFGAALLYDETADSFTWLFETFLEAHKSKRPCTIFTDQDAAMAKALAYVMPDTRHGLCTWHLMQNAIKNVGNLMKDGSHFMTDFKKLMYEYVEVEEFEDAWGSLLSKYDATANSWLKNIYGLKEKWARSYMKSTVTLGMRSTQLSESLNGDLKDYLKCSLNMNAFFNRFDKVVNDKRYKEVQAEFNAREKFPRILIKGSLVLQQAAKEYTPKIFELFQDECTEVFGLVIKEKIEREGVHEYVVGKFGECSSIVNVSYTLSNGDVKCACNHFFTSGYLCCHALKVLDILDIKLIPPAYILKRWTRGARDGMLETHGLNTQVKGDMDATDRYREMCPELVKLAVEASDTVEGYEYIMKMISTAKKDLHEIKRVECTTAGKDVIPLYESVSNVLQKCRGLKKKEGHKGGKRHRSCLEKGTRKKKNGGEASSQTFIASMESVNTEIPHTYPQQGYFTNLLSECDGPWDSFRD